MLKLKIWQTPLFEGIVILGVLAIAAAQDLSQRLYL